MKSWRFSFRTVVILMCVGFISCSGNNGSANHEHPYKIENMVLKQYLTAFDSAFGKCEQTRGRGLHIACVGVYADSVVYSIGYMWDYVHGDPIIFCEPVNGKPVIMTIDVLGDDFSMDITNFIEFTKNVSPEEYKRAKEVIARNQKQVPAEGFVSVWTPISINDFISLRLTFDKSQNLLNVDTLGVKHENQVGL